MVKSLPKDQSVNNGKGHGKEELKKMKRERTVWFYSIHFSIFLSIDMFILGQGKNDKEKGKHKSSQIGDLSISLSFYKAIGYNILQVMRYF